MVNEYGFDCDKYITNIPRPRKNDFIVKVPVAMFIQTKTVEFFDEKSYLDECHKFNEDQKRLDNLFVNDLFEYVGIGDNPKRMKLLDKVRGQYDGEKEMIWEMVCEWVDLIKD